MLMNSRSRPPFGSCMLMNSRGGFPNFERGTVSMDLALLLKQICNLILYRSGYWRMYIKSQICNQISLILYSASQTF